MSCNVVQERLDFPEQGFQSLSGFLMSCNRHIRDRLARDVRVFQSLSGFLMSCNLASLRKLDLIEFGFNPYRVF